MVCTVCVSCCVRRVSSPCSDSHLNSNSSPFDHLGPMKKSECFTQLTHSMQIAYLSQLACFARLGISQGMYSLRMSRASSRMLTYSIDMRTVRGVSCGSRDKSCNFAECLIATRVNRSFYSVRTNPLRQHTSCVSLTVMNSARNSMGLPSPCRCTACAVFNHVSRGPRDS